MKIKNAIILLVVLMCLCNTSVLSEGKTWELTQYPMPPQENGWGMFYTLTNNDTGNLIIVDGGYASNAENIARIIEANGGYVNAWILTHYHADHAAAFNELWNDYNSKIKSVYVTPLDEQVFKEYHKEWDDYDTFCSIMEKTKHSDKFIRVYQDDLLDIADGLTMKVYCACNDEVYKYPDSIGNNCSIVFKLITEDTDVLFFGDLQTVKLGEYLISYYGNEELHANYLQAAHHGNQSMPLSFYQQINPDNVFFDGAIVSQPAALELMTWCEKNGIGTYDYKTAPNTVQFD